MVGSWHSAEAPERGLPKQSRIGDPKEQRSGCILQQENSMKISKQEIATCALIAPVFFYVCYHDVYLCSSLEGEKIIVENAVQDAISGSGRADLEFSRISGYHCKYLDSEPQGNVLTYSFSCSTSAVFADGTSAKVTIQKNEYARIYRNGRKYRSPYKMDFTVTIHGLGPDIQGKSSISTILIDRF